MKKFVGVAIVASLALLGCSMEGNLDSVSSVSSEGTAEVKNFTEPVAVRLITASSYKTAHYGILAIDRSFKIRVKNLAYDKKVSIYHELADGSWTNFPATYREPADNGYEIWNAHIGWNTYSGGDYSLADNFVVRYEVNGKVYWDNNNGQNYNMISHAGPILGNGVNVNLTSSAIYNQYNTGHTVFYGTLDIRNLAYNKTVKIVYSTDGWKTIKTAYASFSTAYYPSYSSPIYAPTSYGTEPWSFSVDLGAQYSKVEFAIAYKVNGQTYWDNNYGQNYVLNN